MIYGFLYLIVLIGTIAFFKGSDMNNTEDNEDNQLQEIK